MTPGPSPIEPITPVLTAADVSVVVCAYTEERWDDIVAAVESVSAASEVVLVIDHNPQLLLKAQTRWAEPPVIVVTNRHKQGLSGARNTGIEATSKAVVAFLDDDATARPGWVEALVEAYLDPNVMGAGGHIEPDWQTERPKWWPREFDWVVGCSFKGMPNQRNPIGANMSLRRTVFNEVGGFSSELGRIGKHPVGGEEVELFIRMHRRLPHAVVIYREEAAVDHKVGASRANVKYFRSRCYAEGLSKAIISQLDKEGETLASEWSYTLKTLPLGVLKGIKDGLKGDAGGFGRAAAIVGGLAVTTAGYIRGTLHKGPERNLTEVPHLPETS